MEIQRLQEARRQLQQALDILDDVIDTETEKFNELSESEQESEAGINLDNSISDLQDCAFSISSAISDLGKVA